jgi:hypothetical protein
MGREQHWIDHCNQRVADYCGPGDAAVVDCLQPILGGDANAAEVIRPVIAKFQAAATLTGAVVDIVDHFNKGEGRGKNRISGSMAKAAGPDTVITMNSEPPGIVIGFDLRMDPPLDHLHVEFEPYGFRAFDEEELEDRQKSIQDGKEAKQLHEMFPDGQWYSVKELATRIGISKQAVSNRLEKIQNRLEVEKKGTSHRFRISSNRKAEQ